MCEKALLVAGADPTASDQALIQKILNGDEPVRMWAVAALTNSTIAAGTHSGDGSTISDGDLQYQVHSQWAAFRI